MSWFRGGGWSSSTIWATGASASRWLPPWRGHSVHVCSSTKSLALCIGASCSKLGRIAAQAGGEPTHSMGFLRFNTNASNAHSKFSTCDDGTESTTPLSMSCGPKCGSLGEKEALNRERNMTMNCSSIASAYVFPRVCTRRGGRRDVRNGYDSQQCPGCPP